MIKLEDLTLLCVDDNEDILAMYKELFPLMFKKVFFAKNGKEGLDIFKSNKIDIILTDEIMPVMNGIEMIKEIRKIDKNIPIILATAVDDKNILKNSIDLNIISFIQKPIMADNLMDAFNKAIEVPIKNKFILNEQNEKLKYNSYQEQLAYEKERTIIKVDSDLIKKCKIDIFYKPLDITSGDSFSVREDTIFLVDAMGKGVSASVTAMMATSFFNYLIDKGYKFEDLIKEFSIFIQKNLLDYEVLSCGFYKFEKDKLLYAVFSMPAFLVKKDGIVEKVKSNNSPLSSQTDDINVSHILLEKIDKILIFSDGLSENFTKDDKLYLAYLKEDFNNSDSFSDFEDIRSKKIKKQSDDTTYFYIKKVN